MISPNDLIAPSRRLAALLPAMPGIVAIVLFHAAATRAARQTLGFPSDSYYYFSMAEQMRQGQGPSVGWPQGPHNKYFPGYGAWRALFMPRADTPAARMRGYAAGQTLLLALIWSAAFAFGRALWRDYARAAALGSLTVCAPVVLKWAAMPMAEPLAAFLIAMALTCAAMLDRRASRSPRRRELLVILTLCGAAASITRIEGAFFVLALLSWLVWRRRLPWQRAASILAITWAPLALWQLWAAIAWGEGSFYVAEGAGAFDARAAMAMLLAQPLGAIKSPPAVPGMSLSGLALIAAGLLFFAAWFAAMRGYLGKRIAALGVILAAYWALHALWYYRSDRFNLVVMPLVMAILIEGMGRLADLRRGWADALKRPVLIVAAIALCAAGIHQGLDDLRDHVALRNRETRPLAAAALRRALNAEARSPEQMVFITNLPLEHAIHLPGEKWFTLLPYMADLVPDGDIEAFARRTGASHVALRQPADKWFARYPLRGVGRVIFQDSAVWVARIEPREGAR